MIFNYHPKLSDQDKGVVEKNIEKRLKKDGYKVKWQTSRYLKSSENLSRCHCNNDVNIFLKLKAIVFPYYSDEFSHASNIYEIFLCENCRSMHYKIINTDVDD